MGKLTFRRRKKAVLPSMPPPPPAIEAATTSKAPVKKKAGGARLWMRMDRLGQSELIECDKSVIIKRVSIPARDLRILGPIFSHSSSILGKSPYFVFFAKFCVLGGARIGRVFFVSSVLLGGGFMYAITGVGLLICAPFFAVFFLQ